jgi:hypothetical protein
MATQRTTSNKRDRERAKQLKAAAKRARRAEKSELERDPLVADDNGATVQQLLDELRELHEAFDGDRIGFDAFETQKSELIDRIATRVSNES